MQRTYTNFAGGINTNGGQSAEERQFAGPVILDMGQTEALAFCQDSTNWEGREDGLLKCQGDTATLSAAISGNPTITLDYDFNGTRVVAAGTKVYTVNGSSLTQIYSGITADAYFQACEYDDGSGTTLLILCNGTDKPLQYDGATCSQISFNDPNSIWNDARPQGATAWRGSLLYWGDPTKKYRVYKPQPGSYDNFDNTSSTCDAFDVDPGFGGEITGLKALTDNFLVVYKKKCIRRLQGSAPFGATSDAFELHVVTDAFGCIAPRSLVGSEMNHYFLSEDGLRQLTPVFAYGDVSPNAITDRIRDTINGLNWTNSVVKNACAVYDKANKSILLSVPYGSSTVNNKIIAMRVATTGLYFRGEDEIKASVLGYFNRQVTHGDYAGQIYTHDSANNYNGTSITSTYTSKYIAHMGIGRRKIYRELHFYADADGDGDIIVQWNIQKRSVVSGSATESISAGSNSWDSGVWDTATWAVGTSNIFKIKNLGRGNAIALKFINTSSSQRPKIRQVDMFFDVLGTAKG